MRRDRSMDWHQEPRVLRTCHVAEACRRILRHLGPVAVPGPGGAVTIEEIVEEWRATNREVIGGYELGLVLARHVGARIVAKETP